MSEANTQPEERPCPVRYSRLGARMRDPVIARVELPAWAVEEAGRLALIHGAIVAQARITGDYP